MAAAQTIDSHTQNDLSTLPPVPRNNNLTMQKSSAQQHLLGEYHAEGDTTHSPKRSTSIKRQPRVGQRPSNPKLILDGMERMRQETKLVVLEYLSSLPSVEISARYKCQKERGNSVVKAKTIHSCERPFVEVIEKVAKKKSEHLPLKRRKSEQYDKKVREKLQQMAYPIKKRVSPEVLEDIKQFDKGKLKDVPRRKNRQSLPFLRFQAASANDVVLDTPVTCVALRLEEMSEDIMKDYPELLDEQLNELLTPLESDEKKLTYEDFAKVAKPVFEKQLARFTGSIWTKVALVFYLVKEVLYSGNLTDIQVELLVEYATRFVTETSFDKIKKEGGWVALDSQHDGLIDPYGFGGSLYDPLGDDTEFDTVDGPSSCSNLDESTENVEEEPAGYIDAVKDTFRKWTTYSAAALAVGIGFAYAYLKQQ